MLARRTALAVAGIAVLGCLAGCTSVAGTTGPEHVPPSMSASKELGDFDTIQPCGMVDLKGLPPAMKAEFAPADSFDSCTLHVDSAGARIRVDVGELISKPDDVTESGLESLPSGLQLDKGSPQQGSCAAWLKFAKGIEMSVVAYANDGDGTVDLCTTAATVARNVSGVLAKGPVPHRTYPDNSLATVDPCVLVYADDMDSLGYIGGQNYPAHHECDWVGSRQDNVGLYVHLTFIVGPAPDAHADGGTATQIGGRPSVTISATDGATVECRIDTPGVAFGGAQSNLYEIAEVHVSYRTTDAACQAATALATVVWPKLPS